MKSGYIWLLTTYLVVCRCDVEQQDEFVFSNNFHIAFRYDWKWRQWWCASTSDWSRRFKCLCSRIEKCELYYYLFELPCRCFSTVVHHLTRVSTKTVFWYSAISCNYLLMPSLLFRVFSHIRSMQPVELTFQFVLILLSVTNRLNILDI
jgi:hypothetical protein